VHTCLSLGALKWVSLSQPRANVPASRQLHAVKWAGSVALACSSHSDRDRLHLDCFNSLSCEPVRLCRSDMQPTALKQNAVSQAKRNFAPVLAVDSPAESTAADCMGTIVGHSSCWVDWPIDIP